jgi:hypothetical protein
MVGAKAMNRRPSKPRAYVLDRLRDCGRMLQDVSPVTEFERRRHDQLIAEQIAREQRKADLFNNDPEEAA